MFPAAKAGDPRIMGDLLGVGAPANEKYIKEPAILVLFSWQDQIMQLPLQQGISREDVARDGRAPRHLPAEHHNLAEADALLAAGGDANLPYSDDIKSTPNFLAFHRHTGVLGTACTT